VLQCVALKDVVDVRGYRRIRAYACVAVCGSVLQHVAMHCSALHHELQCVALADAVDVRGY